MPLASACFTKRFRALLNEEQRTSKDLYGTATVATDGAGHVMRGGHEEKTSEIGGLAAHADATTSPRT